MARRHIVEPDSAHAGRRKESGRNGLVPTLGLLLLLWLLRNRSLSLGGTRHKDESNEAG